MFLFVRRWFTWMITRPAEATSIWSVIGWWERRRPSFNLFLAAFGIPSLVIFFVAISAAHELQPGDDAVEPMALFVAPILANIAYTAGWAVEGALLWRRPSRPCGPRLMRLGLLFSLVVILLPAVYWTIVALIRHMHDKDVSTVWPNVSLQLTGASMKEVVVGTRLDLLVGELQLPSSTHVARS